MGLGAGPFKRRDKDKEKHRDKDEPPSKRRSLDDERDTHDPAANPPSGWTYILEDWFCNGNGIDPAPAPAVSKSAMHPAPGDPLSTAPAPVRSLSTDDVAWRARAKASSEERRKGPYELLIKERLMGIYLAVFVKRDVKPLVKGRCHIRAFLDFRWTDAV